MNDAAISGPHAIELIAAAQRQVALKVALQELPDAQREAVLLRFDQGLDYSTIAQMLGRSESTIRSQVFYGLKKLRELLQVQESA